MCRTVSVSLSAITFSTGEVRTIILHVVVYGCETWSLTLREEHRLRVFENRVLRRIFGAERDGVTSSVFHGVGPIVDPFRSHASRSLFNMPVQELKVAALPLDLPCCGPVAHSGEILTTGKSHGKKQDRFFLNDDMDVKKVL